MSPGEAAAGLQLQQQGLLGDERCHQQGACSCRPLSTQMVRELALVLYHYGPYCPCIASMPFWPAGDMDRSSSGKAQGHVYSSRLARRYAAASLAQAKTRVLRLTLVEHSSLPRRRIHRSLPPPVVIFWDLALDNLETH